MEQSISRGNQLRSFKVWASLVFIFFLFIGCVTPIPFQLDPVSVDRVGDVRASACINQDNISIQVMASGYGSGFGLIGAIVDAGVNSSRRSGAEETIAPLREKTKDIKLSDDLLNALTPMLKELPWPRVLDVQMSAKSLAVTPVDVTDNSVLRLYTDYRLSSTADVLEMTTGFAFYLKGDTTASSSGSVYYASKRIGRNEEENEAAIKLWADNEAALYREALGLGIKETVKMLNAALPYAGRKTPARPMEERVGIRVRLTHGRGDFGIKYTGTPLYGWILEQSEDRLLFQSEGGHLYSIPTSDIIKRLT
ncbi:MAG: hypothetical protein PHI34_12415 [Acidobacteriota bacterium]|nr:hypothetical protein [Acidobacteriota bacterium]